MRGLQEHTRLSTPAGSPNISLCAGIDSHGSILKPLCYRLVDVMLRGDPCGVGSTALIYTPHHLLRKLIRGYGEVTALQSLYVMWVMERFSPPKLGGEGHEQPLPYAPAFKSFYPAFRWTTPLGSRDTVLYTVSASPASQADTGLWKGDCAAVIIRYVGYG